jgi:steroid 5-alpha reductase family enzyme
MIAAWLAAATAVTALMALTWVASVIRRDASLVDRIWGFAFIVAAYAAAINAGLFTTRTLVVLTAVTLWGGRLSLYLTWRNYGHGEDARYQAMRAKHPDTFWWRSLLTVYGLQALLATLIAAPLVYAVAVVGPDLFWLDIAATILVAAGVATETAADAQLNAFRRDPNNHTRVLNTGLWAYSRHPNYFGDAVVWVGFALFGIAAGGWWTVYGTVIMIVFLRRLSGVSLTEKRILTEGRRAGYAEYVANTPAFMPRFQRSRHP